MTEKSLSLEEIQNIANVIDMVKASDNANKIEVKAIYWLGRLRDWCTPIVKQINDSNNDLIKTHTIKKNDDGSRKINSEKHGEAYKELLAQKESIKIPAFKASQFVKGDESLVPTDFWQLMAPHIEIDVDWMKEEK